MVIQLKQQSVSPDLKPGKYTLEMEFDRESADKFHESLGATKLYVKAQYLDLEKLATAAFAAE
jgi:hypothetical protein